jgi:hypothetical protein
MLEFDAQDSVRVYAGPTGMICFESGGDVVGYDESAVLLTIGQFRKIIKYSDELISQAEENKKLYEESKNA